MNPSKQRVEPARPAKTTGRARWPHRAAGVPGVLACTILTLGLLVGGAWAKDIDWQKSYDGALEQAKKDKKVVLVDIYTDWCGWCKKLDRDTYSDPGVQAKVAKDFIAVKLNPEKSEAGSKLAHQFGVRGYPYIVFVGADGRQISQIGGYVNAARFLNQLELITKPNSAK